MHLFLKHTYLVKYKVEFTYKSAVEFHNYLQEQRVRFSILLSTGLSLFPRGQWQLLLASVKKIGQEWMVFTSHTKFSVTACQEALLSSIFFGGGAGESNFWQLGTYLRLPNKYIFILNWYCKKTKFVYSNVIITRLFTQNSSKLTT